MSHYKIESKSFKLITFSDGIFPVSKDFFIAGGDNDITVRSYPDLLYVDLNFVYLEYREKSLLFDAGFGKKNGLTSGHLKLEMKKLDIDPCMVDYVIISHTHMDHIGGLLDNNKPSFPKAEHIISKRELMFIKQSGDLEALHTIKRINHLLNPITQDIELLPGLILKHQPGHTPGLLVADLYLEEQRILLTGDVFNIPHSITNTNLHVVLEEDIVKGKNARDQLIQGVANEDVFIHACHFPYPGFGKILRTEDNFIWSNEVPRINT